MAEYFVDVQAKLIKLPDNRFYETPFGVFPSATTVLHAKAKEGLENWKVAIAMQGIDPKSVSRDYMDKGRKVHHACEAWMKGEALQFFNPETGEENYSLYDEWLPIIRFTKAFEELEIEPILIEQTLYNPEERYAGTMDLLCRLKPDKKAKEKVLALVDLKTSSSAWVDYHWQLAAYREAFYATLESDEKMQKYIADKIDPSEPLLLGILLLKVETAKGWRLTEVDEWEGKYKAFLACKTIWEATHKSYEYWKGLYPTTLKKENENV
jgi:hypothetical protein